MPPLLFGLRLSGFLGPLLGLRNDFRRRGRLAVEPRPKRRQISGVELLLGGHGGDGGSATTSEPVAVLQGRRKMRCQRWLAVGPGMASVETAERLERLFGPIRSLSRWGEAETRGQQNDPRRDIARAKTILAEKQAAAPKA